MDSGVSRVRTDPTYPAVALLEASYAEKGIIIMDA